MWIWQRCAAKIWLVSLIQASLIVIISSFGTFHGRERILERQRRVASPTKWSQPVYTPTGYGTSGNANSYQQQPNSQAQSPNLYTNNRQAPSYNQQYSSYPTNAATYQQYVTSGKNTAYTPAGQPQSAAYPQYPNPATQAGNTYLQQYPVAGGAAPQTTQQANNYGPNNGYNSGGTYGGYGMPQSSGVYSNKPASTSYPGNKNTAAGVYPSVQSNFAKTQYAQPGSPEYTQQNYALYQDPARTPMQYGYNPYGNQQPNNNMQGRYNQGANMYGQAGQQLARSAQPLVTPAPVKTAEQYDLVEFCKKPDREPKCKKNSFGMCDSQDGYPSEVATEFYAYYKSRITAMTTDYDYSNSDQYDTGFATQQNKLIDFVHDIFDDNEYGNLPGVPPQKKGLCVGVSDILQPGWAKTVHGKNMVIMNSNNVKQTIRAEVCKNVGKGCQTVPKCYKSECRQRYRYDTVLVFDPCDAKRAPMLELFKIPDGCECFVIAEEPESAATDGTLVLSSNVLKKHPQFPPSGTTVAPTTADLKVVSPIFLQTGTTASSLLSSSLPRSTVTTTVSESTGLPVTTTTTTISLQSRQLFSDLDNSKTKPAIILSPR